MYVLEIPCFDLKSIFLSKQPLRWIKVTDAKYIVFHKDKALKIEQNKQRIIFDCTEDEVLNFWWNYFDLSIDYNDLFYKIRSISDELKIIANRSKGIHILQQDVFEMMIYSILKRTGNESVLMQEIAKRVGIKHGKSMKEMGMVTWYEFPSSDRMLKKWNCLKGLELGDLSKKIFEISELVSDGWLDINALVEFERSRAFDYLKSFDDFFNEEEISFICLYALHQIDKFPLDKNALNALEKFGMSFDDFYGWYIDGNHEINMTKGLLRQYLIYTQFNEPKRVEIWMRQ